MSLHQPSGIAIDAQPNIAYAINQIKVTYGVDVSVEKKAKSLIKFGRNSTTTNAATGSTVMTFVGSEDHETYVSSNIIDTISSSSTSDDQEITLEGHTIANNEFTFVVQTATLDGQNKVTLSTPLARLTRMYNIGSTDVVGNIYGYQDQNISAGVPQTADKVHCIIPIGRQQSQKCSTTISKNDYWLITGVTGSVLEKTSSFADFELQIRRYGGVFRSSDTFSASSGDTHSEIYTPYIIIPSNSDVRLVAVGSADNLDVAGSIRGYLAIIK